MGWPFEEASWNAIEGAYYAAAGAETFWVLLSAAICVLTLVVGAKHENDAYKSEQDRTGN